MKDIPKYQIIKNEILELIETGELLPGDKLPTELEFEKKYKVSRITVARAIKELQNMGLLYRVKGSGTYVNSSSTRIGRSGNDAESLNFISVIFPHGEQNGAQEMFIGIEEECCRNGFMVMVNNSRNNPEIERRILEKNIRQGCKGIILYPSLYSFKNADLISDLIIRKIPFIFVDRKLDFIQAPIVASDNFSSSYELVKTMIQSGHNKIGFFCSSSEEITSEKERFNGYCKALIDGGLPIRNEYIFRMDRALGVNWGQDNKEVKNKEMIIAYAKSVIAEIRKMNESPSCLIAVNDLNAIYLMREALKQGFKIPDDLSITGFDNLEIVEHLDIPLTTIAQDFHNIGTESVRILLQMIKGERITKDEIRVPTKLIIRKSTR